MKRQALGIPDPEGQGAVRERVKEARAQFQSEQPVDKSGERWRSAVHESAHGVTAIAQGQECYGLQLFDDDGVIAATCRLDSNRLTLPTVYAGAVAELKQQGRSYQRPGETDAGDLTLINNLVERMHPFSGTDAEQERESLKEEGRAVARRLVNAHWATIREVASKLYSRGSLSGDEVSAMVKDSKATAATD